jgi:glycosyltransferase involved in cell wall biosynthesis
MKQQQYPRESYEILMVDNGSTDGSAELVREYPGVRYLLASGGGAYHARNMGVEKSSGEIIAFTDVDCLPSSDWLLNIESALQCEETAILLGRVSLAGHSHPLRALAAYENAKVEWVCESSDPSLYFGYTNNMAVRRSWYEQAGPFELSRRGGDTILVHRILQAAGPEAVIYAPNMHVEHLEVGGVRDWIGKRFVYGRSSKRYRNIVPSRSLTMSERILVRSRMHKALKLRAPLAYAVDCTLIMGLFAFTLGTYTRWFSNSNDRSRAT